MEYSPQQLFTTITDTIACAEHQLERYDLTCVHRHENSAPLAQIALLDYAAIPDPQKVVVRTFEKNPGEYTAEVSVNDNITTVIKDSHDATVRFANPDAIYGNTLRRNSEALKRVGVRGYTMSDRPSLDIDYRFGSIKLKDQVHESVSDNLWQAVESTALHHNEEDQLHDGKKYTRLFTRYSDDEMLSLRLSSDRAIVTARAGAIYVMAMATNRDSDIQGRGYIQSRMMTEGGEESTINIDMRRAQELYRSLGAMAYEIKYAHDMAYIGQMAELSHDGYTPRKVIDQAIM